MDKITIERETLERAIAYLEAPTAKLWPAGTLHGIAASLRAALAAQPAEQSMRPLPDHDNHHNALKCPYCNPRELKFADPDAAPKAWLAGDGYWVRNEDKPFRPDKDRFREPVYAAQPAPAAVPLTDEQIERLREATFSTNNPFCPVDSKSMRKAVRAAERAHGIAAAGKATP